MHVDREGWWRMHSEAAFLMGVRVARGEMCVW
jgi:hypothetical protein